MRRLRPPEKAQEVKLEWLKDRSVYRVRRSDWSPDQFNVVEWDRFEQIQSVCKEFYIPFEEIGE